MGIKKIPIEAAVGSKLAYDLTQVIPGEFKGARFKKGELIKEGDLSILREMGKENIYILDLDEDHLHEDEAAARISEVIRGSGIDLTLPQEGKIYLQAQYPGLLKIDKKLLFEANRVDDVLITASHDNIPVEKEEKLAGVRVNPLVVEENKVIKVEELMKEEEVIKVLPFDDPKVGIIVTGNEVYSGRIEDKFLPLMKNKFSRWKGRLLDIIYLPDDKQKIKEAILELKDKGAEVIITSGGMSVDADDVTPEGIRATGAEIISYGAPVLPGNKLMLAYLDGVPIIGLPAAVIFYNITVFDLIYPRLLAGERITKEDIIRLSHGGLCHHCQVCQYPHCSFGKGY